MNTKAIINGAQKRIYKCPYSLEECRKRRTTIVYPEGKPQGPGLFENMKPAVIQINCMCWDMILKELRRNV